MLFKINTLEEYEKQINMSYDELVEYLLNKYGPSSEDYFLESSYEKFLKGINKGITNGKHARTSEGLYCHHIDENKFKSLCCSNFIKLQNVPFDYQRKDRLVYCDLIEHAILHILIAVEDKRKGKWEKDELKLGIGGYIDYLRPRIINYYMKGFIPSYEWKQNIKNKIKLSKNEIRKLVDKMDERLMNDYPITLEDILIADLNSPNPY